MKERIIRLQGISDGIAPKKYQWCGLQSYDNEKSTLEDTINEINVVIDWYIKQWQVNGWEIEELQTIKNIFIRTEQNFISGSAEFIYQKKTEIINEINEKYKNQDKAYHQMLIEYLSSGLPLRLNGISYLGEAALEKFYLEYASEYLGKNKRNILTSCFKSEQLKQNIRDGIAKSAWNALVEIHGYGRTDEN